MPEIEARRYSAYKHLASVGLRDGKGSSGGRPGLSIAHLSFRFLACFCLLPASFRGPRRLLFALGAWRIVAGLLRAFKSAKSNVRWRVRIAMQLLELIDYGPNTFGTHKQRGEDSENIDKNVR
jgi:hypothetical protein